MLGDMIHQAAMTIFCGPPFFIGALTALALVAAAIVILA